MINNFKKGPVLFFAAGIFLLFLLAFFIFPVFASRSYLKQTAAIATSSNATTTATTTPVVSHLKTPKPMRSIYMTACVAGSKTLRARLVKMAQESDINSIVINIKDETGKISIKTSNPLFLEAYNTSGCPVRDMKEFVEELHQKNIYAIARIAVFQDPFLVKKHPEWAVRRASDGMVWKDRKGISWLDVKATPVWDYTAALAKESYNIGFDEINLDYIRFPSDGNMKDISYPFYRSAQQTKALAVRDFFSGIHDRMASTSVPISADLFGMTCTNTDDLGIGQVLENALPFVDYVAPMVYPSHYPPGWGGYKQPATVPYQVIKFNMDAAVKRAIAASSSPQKIRPWIQDFNLGAYYTADMIKAQIRAAHDAGLDSYMVWDPKNVYTRAAYGYKYATSTNAR